MARIACLLCVSLCVLRGIAQNLDNIDVLEPRWRVSPDRASPTLAGVNDYFGWTAIFHAREAPDPQDDFQQAQDRIRVIVGAPFGTFPGGLTVYNDTFEPRVNQTGLVYSCPLSSDTCEGVTGNLALYINDEARSNNIGGEVINSGTPFMPVEYAEGRMFDQAPDSIVRVANLGQTDDYDFKQGQLMGAVLYSTGDIFMACAPRWRLILGLSMRNTESVRGMCFSGNRNLESFLPRMACTSTTTETNNNNLDLQCVAGHSAVVNGGHFVIGAPGYENNRGVLTSVQTSDPSHTTFNIGNFDARYDNGTVIPTTNTQSQDQYQGFRTVNAYILRASNSGLAPNLVTSVPRASINKDGRLHVYESPTTLSNLIFTNATGDQIGEFFGYSLAAGDLDNDMYDEVIVGAPMYTDFSTNTIEKGRVYIFRNSQGELSGVGKIIIDGPSSLPARARFGSSLTTLGDVDRDGYRDFAVGAPYYQAGSSSNTGAVFIYYGRADLNDIPNQTPFMITADTMAMNVALNGNLATFGFSLSSGHDVDNNGYNDLLVGAYESQSVFVLRSLPVADVTVTFVAHPIVDIDTSTSFTLDIMATLSGLGVAFTLDVPFQINEVLPPNIPSRTSTRRVFFDAGMSPASSGMGTFSFSSHNSPVTASVVVYTSSDISDFRDFMFSITLLEVSRTVSSPVSGTQAFTDLSSFPRLRLQGENMTQVEVQNFCGSDGCESDVRFMSDGTITIPVVANGPAEGQVMVTVINDGPEPALNMEVFIDPLPDYVTGVSANQVTCSTRVNSSVTCNYQERFNENLSVQITFTFQFDTTMLIGNELNTPTNLLLRVPAVDGNRDGNPNNNQRTLSFDPRAEADISVLAIEFNPATTMYTGMAPTPAQFLAEGVNAFNTEITLDVTIGNEGPSTIQNATLDVFFPSREESITGAVTFLYPFDIQPGPIITCSRTLLDPEGIERVSRNMGKRSAVSLSEKMARRKRSRAASVNSRMASFSKRSKRQQVTFDLDCSPGSPTRASCSMFTCNITDFRRDNASVLFRSRLDERFFATLSEDSRRNFNLRAFATVRIDDTYITGDEDTDNELSGDLIISPTTVQPTDSIDLLHAILWPALASLILLVILVIVLYFCGFFRRKRKHEEEGEIEGGDFPTDGAGTSFSPEKPPVEQKEEITGL